MIGYNEGKLPPHSIEVENNIIYICLYDPKGINYCDSLEAEHFYSEKNKEIFKSIKSCHHKNKTVDIIMVTEELKTRGMLELVGGAVALVQLSNKAVYAPLDHVLRWVQYLKQYYVLREIIRSSYDMQSMAYSNEHSGSELLEKQSAELVKIQSSLHGDIKETKLETLIQRTIKDIESTKEGLRGISTGSEKVDKIIGGWSKGELIILAARPGQGKTARMLDFVINAAYQEKKIMIFSLEMVAESLVKRLISRESNVSNSLIGRNTLTTDEWGRINQASSDLNDLPIFIDDTSAVTLSYITSSARIHKIRFGLDMICIDYLQLIRSSNKSANRDVQIGEISNGLKSLSKELGVPIIALSQLSREAEKRSDKKPMLSDLRESGNIEQDADIVLGLHRPCTYYDYDNHPDVKDGKVRWTSDEYPLISQIIPLKFREGAINVTITEYFQASTYRYTSGDYMSDQYISKIGENNIGGDNKFDNYEPF